MHASKLNATRRGMCVAIDSPASSVRLRRNGTLTDSVGKGVPC